MVSLFDPLTLRGLTIPNRIFLAPMCQYQCEQKDGVPRDWHLVHLGARATGGFGLIIAEATGVVPEGRITPQCPGLWNTEQQEAWKRIVDFCHIYGATMAIQLAHAGRKASTYRGFEAHQSGSVPLEDGGWETIAPSAVAFPGLATPREATTEDIAHVVDSVRRRRTSGRCRRVRRRRAPRRARLPAVRVPLPAVEPPHRRLRRRPRRTQPAAAGGDRRRARGLACGEAAAGAHLRDRMDRRRLHRRGGDRGGQDAGRTRCRPDRRLQRRERRRQDPRRPWLPGEAGAHRPRCRAAR